MIWNAKAVNHSSKCNPGSQRFWFELSPRLISSTYASIMRQDAACGTEPRLRATGLPSASGAYFSTKVRDQLPGCISGALLPLLEEIENLTIRIRVYDKQIEELSRR